MLIKQHYARKIAVTAPAVKHKALNVAATGDPPIDETIPR
jgi:hypothetical protein